MKLMEQLSDKNPAYNLGNDVNSHLEVPGD